MVWLEYTHIYICRHTILIDVPYKCPALLFRCAAHAVSTHLHGQIYIDRYVCSSNHSSQITLFALEVEELQMSCRISEI